VPKPARKGNHEVDTATGFRPPSGEVFLSPKVGPELLRTICDSGSNEREDFMGLYVVHDSEEKMGCSFNALVIKNKALAKHYKSGLKGFLKKNPGARCNNHITVISYMGGGIDKTMDELIVNGLTIGEDFGYVDAACFAMYYSIFEKGVRQKLVDVRVSWLKARYVDGVVYVWYSEGR
jgi:hypothetical protein